MDVVLREPELLTRQQRLHLLHVGDATVEVVWLRVLVDADKEGELRLRRRGGRWRSLPGGLRRDRLRQEKERERKGAARGVAERRSHHRIVSIEGVREQ